MPPPSLRLTTLGEKRDTFTRLLGLLIEGGHLEGVPMPTIYRKNPERISVADAKQLILNALPPEHGGAQIFGTPGPDGEVVWDVDSLVKVSASEACAPYIDRDFLELCKGLGFAPHMMFSPAISGYSGNPDQDNSHMLTHAQFVMLAEKYSLTVEVETANPAPAQDGTELAVLHREAPAEKRQAQRWQMCLDAGLKMPTDTFSYYPRGISRVAKKLGIERQSLREDLDKFRERTMNK